jgi:ABC-type polysaccharide/polyol phosphate export permease
MEQAIVVGLFDLAFAAWLRAAFVLASVAMLEVGLSSSLLLAPLLLVGLVGAGLALGMLVALPGLLVDDVGRALGFVLAIGTLACPIFYPISGVPFLSWNPLARLIDGARASLTGQPVGLLFALAILVVAAALLACAVSWLRLGRRHFVNAIA